MKGRLLILSLLTILPVACRKGDTLDLRRLEIRFETHDNTKAPADDSYNVDTLAHSGFRCSAYFQGGDSTELHNGGWLVENGEVRLMDVDNKYHYTPTEIYWPYVGYVNFYAIYTSDPSLSVSRDSTVVFSEYDGTHDFIASCMLDANVDKVQDATAHMIFCHPLAYVVDVQAKMKAEPGYSVDLNKYEVVVKKLELKAPDSGTYIMSKTTTFRDAIFDSLTVKVLFKDFTAEFEDFNDSTVRQNTAARIPTKAETTPRDRGDWSGISGSRSYYMRGGLSSEDYILQASEAWTSIAARHFYLLPADTYQFLISYDVKRKSDGQTIKSYTDRNVSFDSTQIKARAKNTLQFTIYIKG